MVVCSICFKYLRSEYGLEMHLNAVHHLCCPKCGKKFRSERAKDQHFDAVHATYSTSDESKIRWTPEPPVNTPGAWVSREEFTGHKSFGYFFCRCGKHWVSAHSFPNFQQGCKSCEAERYPDLLWRNDQKRSSEDYESEEGESTGPHDQARCEACRSFGRACWLKSSAVRRGKIWPYF